MDAVARLARLSTSITGVRSLDATYGAALVIPPQSPSKRDGGVGSIFPASQATLGKRRFKHLIRLAFKPSLR